MKSISLLLCITLFIFPPSILLAKQICLAPSGCKIEMDTGLCPKCIEVDELPIIKEEKVVVGLVIVTLCRSLYLEELLYQKSLKLKFLHPRYR